MTPLELIAAHVVVGAVIVVLLLLGMACLWVVVA